MSWLRRCDVTRRAATRNGTPQHGLMGIAAPHVSPEGGWQSYREAYSVLRPEHRERTFVVLATSHYGAPERFGLTRKTFRTPLGEVANDTRLVDWLAERAPKSIEMEDFCHSFEHTVELQLIFLQHALGPGVRILPILCGPFARSVAAWTSMGRGGKPEDDDKVKAFLEALGEMREREGDKLFWILGVDMAHMGARYQDRFAARRRRRPMAAVDERDRAAHCAHQRLRRLWLLESGAGEPRRSEVVRLVAVLHLPEDRARMCAANCCAMSSGISTTNSVVSFAGMSFTEV